MPEPTIPSQPSALTGDGADPAGQVRRRGRDLRARPGFDDWLLGLDASAAVVVREVRGGDEAAIDRLLGGLDPESRYTRWFTGGVDLEQAEDWAAHPERSSAVGLLAFADDEPVGHAVLIPAANRRGEVAFEVAAPWRHHGIAGTLLDELVQAAAVRGMHEIYADVLGENADMLAVLREHGQHAEAHHDGIVTVTLDV